MSCLVEALGKDKNFINYKETETVLQTSARSGSTQVLVLLP